MKISVLVPTLGTREQELNRLLHSLYCQSFKNFEIIVVSQNNHIQVAKIIESFPKLAICQVKLKRKGLSVARNVGIKNADGEIIILSDDDCWYPPDALESIAYYFEQNKSIFVLLTQIYDKNNEMPYKKYSCSKKYITNKLELMSKSSIEIAYRRHCIVDNTFNERFGLGAEFVCGEEVDFLLRNYKKNKYLYAPNITVYHNRKNSGSSAKQIVAKGALYAKNFNILISIIILVRDFIIKRENNFSNFFEGYYEYRKRKD